MTALGRDLTALFLTVSSVDVFGSVRHAVLTVTGLHEDPGFPRLAGGIVAPLKCRRLHIADVFQLFQ